MDNHTITVMGDSIAVGLGDPVPGFPDRAWADQLASMLGIDPAAGLRNLGVVGARLDEIVESQLDTALHPVAEVTVFTGGGNDILGRAVDWDRLERLLELAVSRLRSADTRVVTFGLFDISCTELVPERHKSGLRDRIQQLNSLTAAATERHGGHFIDFFGHPEQSAELFSADGLHPNRRAHRLIAVQVHDRLTGMRTRPDQI